MALTRRQFLKRSATLAAGASMAPAMRWLPGTNVAYAAGPSDAIVVFVELFGGNDGLNTVYPVTGGQRTAYETYRPTLKLPKPGDSLAGYATEGFNVSSGVLTVGTDDTGTTYALHPAMKAMHDIYLDGKLAVIPGVHYPYADYSHFRSEVIYYTGDPVGTTGLGWMGKYLELSGSLPTDVPAVMMGDQYSPLFTPTTTGLFAFNSLRELRFPAGSRTTQRSTAFSAMYAESALSDEASYPELKSIGNTGVASVNKFQEYYKPGAPQGKVEALMVDGGGNYETYNPLVYDSPVNPGNGTFNTNYLTDDLRHVAAIIRSNVGARYFHVGIGGFDTHSNQESGYYHSHLLNNLSEALGAFWAEMKQSAITLPGGYSGYLTGDLSSRVLIVTLSEFGRTNKQNSDNPASAGTDHGRSSPQFVIGSTVQAGVHGTYPALVDVDLPDDLRMTHDFRNLHGTILERWLNVAPSDIGPGDGKLFAATPDPDDLGQTYTAYAPIPFLLP